MATWLDDDAWSGMGGKEITESLELDDSEEESSDEAPPRLLPPEDE